jgi:hypothetical protein
LESPVRHDNITTAYIPHHRPKNCPEPPLAIAPQPSETGYETEKGEEQKLKEEEIPKKKKNQNKEGAGLSSNCLEPIVPAPGRTDDRREPS